VREVTDAERDPESYVLDEEERERIRLDEERRERVRVIAPRPRTRPVLAMAAMAMAVMSGMPGGLEVMGSPFDDVEAVRRRPRSAPARESGPLLDALARTGRDIYAGSLRPEPVFLAREEVRSARVSGDPEELRRQVKREAEARSAKLAEVKRRRREERSK
jgi:hypothetical protein